MLKVISDKSKIQEAQNQFKERIIKNSLNTIVLNLGFQGGNIELPTYILSDFNIWFSGELIEGAEIKRYWNAFGIGKPDDGSNQNIICEINFPEYSIYRRIGGAFVEDELGKIYVIHRGLIGGGRKDIGKDTFLKHFRGKLIDIEDGDRISKVALIGEIDSPRFLGYLSNFVFEIDRIKKLATGYELIEEDSEQNLIHLFNEEFYGNRKYDIRKIIESKCDHGLVVNSLADRLQKRGFNVANDVHRDLYTYSSNNTIELVFEIKTDISLSSIYKGIGQLLLNNINLLPNPKLYLVIPKQVDFIEQTLLKLKINTLMYELDGNDIVIFGLDDF